MNLELSSDRVNLQKRSFRQDNYNSNESSYDSDNKNDSIIKEQEDSSNEDSIESDEISEEENNDFGFYEILNEEEYANDPKYLNNINNFLKINTIPKSFNFEKKRKAYKQVYSDCKKIDSISDLIETFSKINNDYQEIEIPDISLILNDDTKDPKDIVSLDDKNLKLHDKKEILNNIVETETELYLNTMNSYILEDQRNLILQNNYAQAKDLNFKYQRKKLLYEANLVEFLVQKYSSDNANLIFINSFENLKKSTEKFRNKLSQLRSNASKETCLDLCDQGKNYLSTFIRQINKEMTEKAKKQEYEKNFEKWKLKLSELVNIWDLNTKEGIQLKFPHKYLILKKFIMRRSFMQQNNIDFIKEEADNSNIFSQLLGSQLKLIGLGEKESKTYATSLIFFSDTNKIIFDIIFALTLIYSYITVPMRIFMGFDNEYFNILEKYVDLVFYIEMCLNFRTIYTDKFNEAVKDINNITKNYIYSYFITDFISSVPWQLLFISSKRSYSAVKAVVNCLKLFRIIKLAPVFDKLNQIKSIANWFRLVKLFIVYFFMAHWSACIMYTMINDSIEWGNMINSCYSIYNDTNKYSLNKSCRFVLSFYNGSYFITGQITENVTAGDTLQPTSEYVFLIVAFIIGQILSAYIFGGMASVIQSLNDGEKVFTDKIDIIMGHMLFYNVSTQVTKDVKIYYDYLWQRHKDLISGKGNFYLLSKSLREKFERLNLPGNEIYLAKFINLNSGSSKLVGNILMGLEKQIMFPFEILFEEGSITKGLYILLNGDIELTNKLIPNVMKESYKVEMGSVMQQMKDKNKDNYKLQDKDSVIFPLVPAFIKTGRNYQICFSRNFTDVLFLPLEKFNEILVNFPIEMHVLRHSVMAEVAKNKLFENKFAFEVISQHSSRSVGKYYEKEFNKFSIWIPIPIPISQRKIAKNYIKSFMNKVRNQWKEIILSGDLNINLGSHLIVNIIKNKEMKNYDLGVNKNVSNVEKLKILSRNLMQLGNMYEEFSNNTNNVLNNEVYTETYEEEEEGDL